TRTEEEQLRQGNPQRDSLVFGAFAVEIVRGCFHHIEQKFANETGGLEALCELIDAQLDHVGASDDQSDQAGNGAFAGTPAAQHHQVFLGAIAADQNQAAVSLQQVDILSV